MFRLSREAATAPVTTVGPPSASKAQPRLVLAPAGAQARSLQPLAALVSEVADLLMLQDLPGLGTGSSLWEGAG